jgi:hypothetical protein
MWFVALLRAQAAIAIVYRLYGEGRFPLPALITLQSIVVPKLSTRDRFTR